MMHDLLFAMAQVYSHAYAAERGPARVRMSDTAARQNARAAALDFADMAQTAIQITKGTR